MTRRSDYRTIFWGPEAAEFLEAVSKIPSHEDENASQMNKSPVIVQPVFMPDKQAAKVLEPSEEAFDLPPSAIPAERPPVLGFGPAAIALVRSNHFDPLFGQTHI